jgi:hypothetical protein
MGGEAPFNNSMIKQLSPYGGRSLSPAFGARRMPRAAPVTTALRTAGGSAPAGIRFMRTAVRPDLRCGRTYRRESARCGT